jgi:hypothetical protein
MFAVNHPLQNRQHQQPLNHRATDVESIPKFTLYYELPAAGVLIYNRGPITLKTAAASQDKYVLITCLQGETSYR